MRSIWTQGGRSYNLTYKRNGKKRWPQQSGLPRRIKMSWEKENKDFRYGLWHFFSTWHSIWSCKNTHYSIQHGICRADLSLNIFELQIMPGIDCFPQSATHHVRNSVSTASRDTKTLCNPDSFRGLAASGSRVKDAVKKKNREQSIKSKTGVEWGTSLPNMG